jgi:hypothetical protein
LLEALIDAQGVIGIWNCSVERPHAHQPGALQKIDEQQRGSDKLRASERVGMKDSPQHLLSIFYVTIQHSRTECFTMSGTPTVENEAQK